ncbi:MAG: T9SS type A sorting domain-containing protein [Bacteroidaceae bacterium]|nr:T9SS type A sorting domain-containing protein [Bacteroidaceae bacterium]
MKKITSFLMMMVMCCVSAFAQFEESLTAVTDLSELNDNAIYTIHSERTFLLYSDACPNVIASGNGKVVGDVTWNPFDEDQQFKIIKIEEKFYLYSVGAQMYVNDGGNYGVAPETEFKIMPSIVGESYPWFLGLGSNFLNSQGAGQTDNGLAINTWGSDQNAHEDAGNHYNIYAVDMSQYDPYAMAFDNLMNAHAAIDATFVDELKAGQNVGDKPGNYIPENVNAFLELWNATEDLMFIMEDQGLEAVQAQYPTAADLDKFREEYNAAYNKVRNDKVPLAMSGIKPGYYTFNNCLFWYTTKNDTVFYTQEEADAANAESGLIEGDEGYIAAGDVKEVKSTQVAQPIKSLHSRHDASTDADWAAWGTQQPKAEFLWKIEAVEGKPTEYRMINMANGKTHISIGQSSNSKLQLNDTATVCFDWRNDEQEVIFANAEGVQDTAIVVAFNIRSSNQAEGAYNYFHCGGHSNGASTGPSWIVGWADGGATRWYMTPVDEATAEEWMFGPEAQLRAMIEKGDSIANAFPAQLEVAKDLVANVDTTKSVANIETFSSPYHCPAEGNMEHLFDGTYNNTGNFWHSNWQSGNGYGYSTQNGSNYFVVEDVNSDINGGLAIMVARRPVANDHLTQLTVYGTNDAYDAAADLERILAGEDDTNTWTELGVLNTPYGNGSEYITSNAIEFEGQFKYYKFVATATTNNRGYFHMGEFRLYPATISKRYETTQYDARQTQADALAAAIAVWEEKEFAADSLELLEDESFAAAYETIVAAAEAWGKVYVNPAALREVIAAAPAENLFVIGNNPGQWKEGVVTPTAIVAAAEAYNAAGAYTPAESEAHIEAIAKAEADVWAAANKIETGKWYRFSFPTEEMFDTYGWGKANIGATINNYEIETASALFGKTLAVGKTLTTYVPYITDEGNEDTVTVHSVETTEEWFNGDNLGFFEEEFTEGEDLFQFIQATDSSYIIQNKATGLFVRGGRPMTLSAIPSYFSSNQALGAGGNAIAYTNVLGEAESAHVYMHAEQQTQLLTAWQDKSALKSMMMIEEVEAVTEAPATEYTTKLWPGKVYTYTMPVDVKVLDGATAYGAELSMEENDTTVVLKAIASETISAGTPFIMIADLNGEYTTTSDRLKQIASQICETQGKYGKNEQALANTQLNDEYALVEMDHGMEVDTVVTELLGLQGTMKAVTVAPGKAVVANENGFAHLRLQTSMAAYSAWLTADFDPKSADVLSTLEINIDGSVDTGISEVLDKVAKSGNIYNAAGQLVGKGNINTVNNLPAGIYIVNGVKVTKK